MRTRSAIKSWTYALWGSTGLFLLIALVMGLIGSIANDGVQSVLASCDPEVASCANDIWLVENLRWWLLGGSLLALAIWIVVCCDDESPWHKLKRLPWVHQAVVWVFHLASVAAVSAGVRYARWYDSTCIGYFRHRHCGELPPEFSYSEGWLLWSLKFLLVTDIALGALVAAFLLWRAAVVVPAMSAGESPSQDPDGDSYQGWGAGGPGPTLSPTRGQWVFMWGLLTAVALLVVTIGWLVASEYPDEKGTVWIAVGWALYGAFAVLIAVISAALMCPDRWHFGWADKEVRYSAGSLGVGWPLWLLLWPLTGFRSDRVYAVVLWPLHLHRLWALFSGSNVIMSA